MTAAYVVAVLTLYLDLPDTPLRPSPLDQSLARKLHEQSVPLPLVESALGPVHLFVDGEGAFGLPLRSLQIALGQQDQARLISQVRFNFVAVSGEVEGSG